MGSPHLSTAFLLLDPWPPAVLVRRRKRCTGVAASTPGLSLSNSYALLYDDAPVHPADAPHLDPPPAASSSLVDNSAGVVSVSTGKPNQQLSSRPKTSAFHRKLLKEAVMRRTGSFPSSFAISITASPQHLLISNHHHLLVPFSLQPH